MNTRSPRRRSTGPTISDVARHAGVSQMTVSRVINGEQNVRAATRDVVEKAITELRYAPNPAARSLAKAGQNRIGVLYANPSAAFLSEFLVGSLDEASRMNAQLVLERCEPAEGEAVTRRLVASGIDGIILPPPLCEVPEVLAVLSSANIPTVALASAARWDECMTVSIDDYRAAFEMTEYLLSLGHTRIGFVKGSSAISASALREQGYRAALKARSVLVDEELIAPGLFTYRSGLIAADTLLDLPEPPTAIFASNDDMAAAAVAMAHRRHLDVPRDLTICGFDDTHMATAMWPELTTVRQPIADMCRVAVDMLVASIRRADDTLSQDVEHRVVDYTLMMRGSASEPRTT